MHMNRLLIPAALTMSLLSLPVIAGPGHGSNVQTMAEVMAHLNHYPSDAEKASLKAIANDSHASAAEKAIANAIANLSHTASDSDKAALQKIANDGSQPASVRDLARIVMNISHKPSADDVQKLKSMK